MANKTRKERRQLLRNLLGEGDLNKGRRLNFLTTSAGASDGTTVVASTVAGVDDGYIGAYLRSEDSLTQGEERVITDFVNSSGTFTVSPAFSGQIATGDSVNMFERGKYSDLDLENSLLQAEYTLAQTLDPNHLFSLQEVFECSLTDGVIRRDTLLSNMVALTMLTNISRTTVFRILPATSLQKLQTSRDPDFATTDRPAAIQAGTPVNQRYGDYWVYPSNIATVEAHFIRKPTDFTLSDSSETIVSDIDNTFERLVILYAAYLSSGEERFLRQYQANVQILNPNIDTPLIGYEGETPQPDQQQRQ